MRKILLLVVFVFISIVGFSQDIISLKNGKRIEVIVTEISPTLVRYKLSKEPKGRVYFVYNDDVAGIMYQDGRVETFNQSDEQAPENKSIPNEDEDENQSQKQDQYQSQSQNQNQSQSQQSSPVIMYQENPKISSNETQSPFVQGGVDTIYYGKNWKGVSNRAYADYYRIDFYSKNDNYKKTFRTYYITGELYASGDFISVDKFDDNKSIFDGEITIYYKNGKVKEKYTWQNGKQNGDDSVYAEDGLLKRKGSFIDGQLNGLYTEFLDNGAYIQAEYLNGKPKYPYYIYGNQDGNIMRISFADNKPIWNSPSVNDRKVEYQDGVAFQYYVNNGLTVALTNTTVKDFGKWHRIDIIIQNNTSEPIEFDPANITASSTDSKDKTSNLEVYSYEKYMKKVKRAQTWSAIAMGVEEGLATMDAGYSTSNTSTNTTYNGTLNSSGTASAYGSGGYAAGSYSGNSYYSGSAHTNSTTTTYDAAEAYQTQVLSQNRMAAFDESQWNVRNAIQAGYLKRNTIYPGKAISGYVNIQRIKGKTISITVSINSADYIFNWLYDK